MTAPAAPMHDVKAASAVLADDVICQSFVQSSSTLAYASLLIRHGNYDLAVHVLHSLEAKQASRFKDMVFYLQSQIGIETGEFATVKRRLVPRVHQHPNDMVALSLLECCIYHEFVQWENRQQASEPEIASRPVFGNAEADLAALHAATYDRPQEAGPQESLVDTPSADSASGEPVSAGPSSAGPSLYSVVAADSGFSGSDATPVPPSFSAPQAPPKADPPRIPAAPAPSRVQYAPSGGTPQDLEFGQFQALANDVNTQAMALWNPEKGSFKSACRNAELETLIGMLPHEVPMRIQTACTSLDCGIVTKISFSFQHLTVTTFHSGSENLGLITGNINQSLLTIVRAENTFRKQAATARSAENAPNE